MVFVLTLVACDVLAEQWTLAGEQLVDEDGDGFADNTDCAAADAAIGPGVTEVSCNSIDDDCDSGTPDCPLWDVTGGGEAPISLEQTVWLSVADGDATDYFGRSVVGTTTDAGPVVLVGAPGDSSLAGQDDGAQLGSVYAAWGTESAELVNSEGLTDGFGALVGTSYQEAGQLLHRIESKGDRLAILSRFYNSGDSPCPWVSVGYAPRAGEVEPLPASGWLLQLKDTCLAEYEAVRFATVVDEDDDGLSEVAVTGWLPEGSGPSLMVLHSDGDGAYGLVDLDGETVVALSAEADPGSVQSLASWTPSDTDTEGSTRLFYTFEDGLIRVWGHDGCDVDLCTVAGLEAPGTIHVANVGHLVEDAGDDDQVAIYHDGTLEIFALTAVVGSAPEWTLLTAITGVSFDSTDSSTPIVAADLDGDGYIDIALGGRLSGNTTEAGHSGMVSVIRGPIPYGTLSYQDLPTHTVHPAVAASGPLVAELGFSLTTVDDLEDDGANLVVGAPALTEGGTEGAVWVLDFN